MAATKATNAIVLAVLVAILLLLMSPELVTAVFDAAVPELNLGRRALQYNTDGRGGYNSYNTTGRGGYN
ncbi:hypothetical protein CJ030_MR3G025377 [Morella rubra]|uniref:Uncharacterized protein n=1 Tax=Morella rubra TaxID=262757 RepID=A0A6A1W6S7_9ROSI|nr:hypothetical protein CJ030_MR3G025377 [Morella rubra]